MKLLKWALAVAMLVAAGIAWAAPPPDADWQNANGGMVRTTKLNWHTGDSLSVQNRDGWVDTTRIVQAGKDTSQWVSIAGIKSMKTWHKIRTVNDSANVTFRLQVSPDTSLGTRYVKTLTTTLAYLKTATTDTVLAKVWYADGDTLTVGLADRDLLQSARFVRQTVTGAVAAGDTMWIGKNYYELIFEAAPTARASPRQ